MAIQNVTLNVTQIEYIIDFSSLTYDELGVATLNVTIPSASDYRYHYRDRELPPIVFYSTGALPSGKSVKLNISSDGSLIRGATTVTYNLNDLKGAPVLGVEIRTLKDPSSDYYLIGNNPTSVA